MRRGDKNSTSQYIDGDCPIDFISWYEMSWLLYQPKSHQFVKQIYPDCRPKVYLGPLKKKRNKYFPKIGLNDKTWLLGQLSELCSAGTISSAFNSTRHSNYTGCVLAVTGAPFVMMHHTWEKKKVLSTSPHQAMIRIFQESYRHMAYFWLKGLSGLHISRPCKYLWIHICTFTRAHIFSFSIQSVTKSSDMINKGLWARICFYFTTNTVWQDNI